MKKTRQRRRQPASATASPASATTPVSAAPSSASQASSSSSASPASASAAVDGSVYRLKISLTETSPQIWRRVLVKSDTPLLVLHNIIQVLFDWNDMHMHEFSLPLPPLPHTVPLEQRVFAPTRRLFRDGQYAAAMNDPWNSAEDERHFTVGQLLKAVRHKLEYMYDFGDQWHHLIQVEAIEPATQANSANLPLCTGGRCAAPAEDSGGTYRHAMMVYFYRKKNGLLPEQKEAQSAQQQQSEQTDEHTQPLDEPQSQQHADEDEEDEDMQEEKDEAEAEEADDEDVLFGDSGSEDLEEDEDDEDVDPTQRLEDCASHTGRDYDPLRFDKAAIDRALEREFHGLHAEQ